jgi:hypothetical protein
MSADRRKADLGKRFEHAYGGALVSGILMGDEKSLPVKRQ